MQMLDSNCHIYVFIFMLKRVWVQAKKTRGSWWEDF